MQPADGCRAELFSGIYTRFRGRVWAYAARRVGSDAADDVAAETFLVAWRRFDDLPAEPLPWLYGVARHVVLRSWALDARAQAVRELLVIQSTVVEGVKPDDAPQLWDAWRRLSQGDREVLALVAWEELRVREAAKVLDCSAAVFSVRLYRARNRLARLIASPSACSSEMVRSLSGAL